MRLKQMKLMKVIFLLLLCSSIFAAPLDDVRKLGVTVTLTKKAHSSIQSLGEPEDRYLLDGKLRISSADQFQKTKQLLHPGAAAIFSGPKDYSLTEFLPPVAAALVNKLYKTKQWNTEKLRPFIDKPEYQDSPYLWPMVKNGLSNFSNCWNTTAQLLRSLHPSWDGRIQFYWPGRENISMDLTDKKFSVKIAEKDVRAGDIIVFGKKSFASNEFFLVQHTAILIGKDLVFEKTDGGDSDPWRMALRSDLISKYKRLLEEEYIVEYRRATRNIFPGFSPSDDTEIHDKLLKKIFPSLNPSAISYGCETGLGGGCDIVATVVESVGTQKVNGKIILNGSADFKNRLIDLK